MARWTARSFAASKAAHCRPISRRDPSTKSPENRCIPRGIGFAAQRDTQSGKAAWHGIAFFRLIFQQTLKRRPSATEKELAGTWESILLFEDLKPPAEDSYAPI